MEIPEIVRAALRADLREHPRFDVEVSAMVERDGAKTAARVLDLSRGGARIASVPHVLAGDDVMIVLPGMRPAKAKVAWIAPDCFGVRFEPVLEAGELLGVTGIGAAA